jgi:Outer membrane protein beta-barrel family
MKNREKVLFFILFVLLTGQIFAQKSIKMAFVDSLSQEVVEFVSAQLFTDSIPVATFFSDTNSFIRVESSKIRENKSYIIFSRIGYFPKKIILTTSMWANETMSVPLVSSIANLKVFQVKGQLLEVKIDRMEYIVANDPLIKNKTAIDALSQMPFIFIDPNKSIEYKGKTNILVLLNSERYGIVSSNPLKALPNIPANLIKKIELITEPEFKYKNAGYDVVINIVTQGYLKGLLASIDIVGNNSDSYNYGGGNGLLFYQKNRIGLQAVVGGQSTVIATTHQIRNDFFSDTKNTTSNEYQFSNLTKPLGLIAEIALNYETNHDAVLNLYAKTEQLDVTSNTNGVFQNIDKKSSLENKVTEHQKPFEIGLNWDKSYKKFNFYINAKSKNTHIDNSTAAVLPSNSINIVLNTNKINSIGDNGIDLGTNIKFSPKLSLGIELNSRLRKYDNDFSLDTNNLNTKDIRSSISQHYLSSIRSNLRYKKNNFLMDVMVGGEYVNYINNFNTNNKIEAFKDYIFNYLFKIKASYKLKNANIARLSIGNDIQRPNFENVINQVNIIDPSVVKIGNIDLTNSNSIFSSLTYELSNKSKTLNAYIEASLRYSPIVLNDYYTVSSSNTLQSQQNNLGSLVTPSVSTGLNYRLSSKFSGNLRHTFNYTTTTNAETKRKNANAYHYIQASSVMNISPKWNIQASYFYTSRAVTFQGYQSYYPSYYLSSTFIMGKGKSNITLVLRNFFTKNQRTELLVEEGNFRYFQQVDNLRRVVTLNFSYRFGNLKVGGPKTIKRVSSDDLRTN